MSGSLLDAFNRIRPHLTEHEAIALRRLIHQHEQTQTPNLNTLEAERITLGERSADRIAATVGSWRFILTQSLILTGWLILNAIAWSFRWDPYPFILLNLVLSFQAAFTAPIIMMSQNRQSSRDRLEAELDFDVNRRAENEVARIQRRLDDLAGQQWDALVTLQREQLDLLRRIESISERLDQQSTQGNDGKSR